MKRAAHRDLIWELGEDFKLAVRWLEPGPVRKPVSQLQPGEYIEYPIDNGMGVHEVFDVANVNNRTTVRLDEGLFHQPKFTVDSTLDCQPIIASPVYSVRAQIALPQGWTDPESTPEFMPIPYTWLDNNTVQFKMEADGAEFMEFISRIDAGRVGGGPSGSTFPYDIAFECGQGNEGRWRRVMQGSFTTIRSSNFPSTTLVH